MQYHELILNFGEQMPISHTKEKIYIKQYVIQRQFLRTSVLHRKDSDLTSLVGALGQYWLATTYQRN